MPPLKVDKESMIPALEKLLKKNKIVIVLVYADWCPACRKFKKNVWGPACSKEAVHERVEVESSLVDKVNGLKGTNFKYLPSVLFVDEKGKVQEFQSPEGPTNAMPTPKSEEEMTRIMNVQLKPTVPPSTPVMNKTRSPSENTPPENFLPPNPVTATPAQNTEEPIFTPETMANSVKTPAGKVYTPNPVEVSPVQKGGNLFKVLSLLARAGRTKKYKKRSTKKKLTRRNVRQ